MHTEQPDFITLVFTKQEAQDLYTVAGNVSGNDTMYDICGLLEQNTDLESGDVKWVGGDYGLQLDE